MPQQLIAEILAEWRDAERLLTELPPLSHDHETVRLAIAQLRLAYARMVDAKDVTQATIAANRGILVNARELLLSVQAKQQSQV